MTDEHLKLWVMASVEDIIFTVTTCRVMGNSSSQLQ